MPRVTKSFNGQTFTLRNTEVFGLTAELSLINLALEHLIDPINLDRITSLRNAREIISHRCDEGLLQALQPAIEISLGNVGFGWLPGAIMRYTGQDPGLRGGISKCPHDFALIHNQTLSVKTNTKTCPPEVGQPSRDVFAFYFGHLGDFNQNDDQEVKQFIHSHIALMLPIYTQWLFYSDYLMSINAVNNNLSVHVIPKVDMNLDFQWVPEAITSTTINIQGRGELNTYRYNGITFLEIQIYNRSNSIKARFDLDNLIGIINNN
jgi:hypothetical protein